MRIGRREFLSGVGGAVAAAYGLESRAHAIRRSTTVGGALAARIQFGYAAITWGGNDRQAIADIAACGFRGIQLRSNVLPEFGKKPAALKELLDRHNLVLVALSSGNMRIDPAVEREELDAHLEKARFVRALGGSFLQLTDERPNRDITAADYKRMGRLLTELGKRTADVGVTVSYHNHMHNLGERPEEVASVLDASDPRLVKLQLDTAHFQQGGGDPARAIQQYGNRLSFLHLKDLQSPAPGAAGDPSRSYRFVELGRGQVDFRKVFAALHAVDFDGWAVVELDRVPDDARTPKESALISRAYLEKELGMTVGPPPSLFF